jgi:hypothetical protein
VQTSLLDADGEPLDTPPALSELLVGGGDEPLAAVYAPLVAALPEIGLDASDIAVATVFTTGDPTAELRAIRDWVAEPANLDAPAVDSLALDAGLDHHEFMTVYGGTFTVPVFQRGELPYLLEGGGFEFEDGEPVIQRWESVRFNLTVPTADPPEGGFPVVVALAGTGGAPYAHFHPHGATSQGLLLSERGVATFGFEAPLVGSRGEDQGASPELHSYNVANPEASRSVFRQEAIDASVAVRFLRESLAPQHPDLQLDPTRLGLFGHSQGAHAGCLLASVEPELDPVFVNGMGGLLSYTLLERTDPLDFEAMIRVAVGEEEERLTVFHPALDVVQLLADAVDPINYGPQWFLRAADGEGTSVLHSGGLLDQSTPWLTVNALAVASGNQPVDPMGWEIPELAWVEVEPLATPFSSNVVAADGEVLSAGLITRADLEHQAVEDDFDVAWAAAEFLGSGLVEGTAVVGDPDDQGRL